VQGGRGEREKERGGLGGARLTSGPHQGAAAAAQPPARSARKGSGGDSWAARWAQSEGGGGWAAEPAHEGKGGG
jgi:hypothetical protein